MVPTNPLTHPFLVVVAIASIAVLVFWRPGRSFLANAGRVILGLWLFGSIVLQLFFFNLNAVGVGAAVIALIWLFRREWGQGTIKVLFTLILLWLAGNTFLPGWQNSVGGKVSEVTKGWSIQNFVSSLASGLGVGNAVEGEACVGTVTANAVVYTDPGSINSAPTKKIANRNTVVAVIQRNFDKNWARLVDPAGWISTDHLKVNEGCFARLGLPK